MNPPLLIVNPACGSRRLARHIPRALQEVERVLGDVVIRYTTRRGHARELARQAVEDGFSLVIAMGGDGTVSEVANGVLEAGPLPDAADAASASAAAASALSADAASAADLVDASAAAASGPGAALGIIDLGTGGDFRRSLGIDSGVEACLAAIASGRERLVDVGRARFVDRTGRLHEQYFLNVLSAGLGGRVDRYIERMPDFLGGKAGYYLAALGAVAVSREQPVQARITWGATREEIIPAYLIAVCNGRWFGSGMDVAPMALPDDGRLEVITITARSKPYLADRVRGVYTGRHLDEPTVHHFPCTKIALWLDDERSARRYLLDVDGEALGSLPLEIEVVPRRLRVRA